MKEFFKNKKILVTGATGFKGSWLCYWLWMYGAKVNGIGYSPNFNGKLFDQLNLKKKINLKIVDIRNFIDLQKAFSNICPEIVFHLAAQPLIHDSYDKPFFTYEVNSYGTLNILEIIRKSKLKPKVTIIITSDKCYESNNSTKGFVETDKLGGIDPYSGSKACAEIITNTYFNSFFKKLRKPIGLATARAGNVIGGGDWSKNRLIPDAIRSIYTNKTIFLRNPNFNRPWQHVLEPLSGYLLLSHKLWNNPKKYSGPWNFGSKKNTLTTVSEVIKRIIKFWGSGKYKVLKSQAYEQKNLQLNISKSQKILGWSPYFSINQAIDFTAEWYKNILLNKNNAEKITCFQIKKFIGMNDKNKKN